MNELTVKEKCQLRSQAHQLKPVVIIGSGGITENLLAEIARALYDHELIKVKLPSGTKEQKIALATQICAHTEAQLIQTIGNIVVIYKKSPKFDT